MKTSVKRSLESSLPIVRNVTSVLVDTGVLLAAVSPRDRHNATSMKLLAEAQAPLVTTVAVLTELFHFVHDSPIRSALIWRYFEQNVIRIAAIDDVDLPALQYLMRRYADRPMDFADATLVHVAGRDGIADILTIDYDDFETYRFGRNRKFRIRPAR
jgi:uncharacterized protein